MDSNVSQQPGNNPFDEFIPCEACDTMVRFTEYSQHVQECGRPYQLVPMFPALTFPALLRPFIESAHTPVAANDDVPADAIADTNDANANDANANGANANANDTPDTDTDTDATIQHDYTLPHNPAAFSPFTSTFQHMPPPPLLNPDEEPNANIDAFSSSNWNDIFDFSSNNPFLQPDLTLPALPGLSNIWTMFGSDVENPDPELEHEQEQDESNQAQQRSLRRRRRGQHLSPFFTSQLNPIPAPAQLPNMVDDIDSESETSPLFNGAWLPPQRGGGDTLEYTVESSQSWGRIAQAQTGTLQLPPINFGSITEAFLQRDVNSFNDYEFNIMLANLMGRVEKGIDDINTISEIVSDEEIEQLGENICTICQERLDEMAKLTAIRKLCCSHHFCEPCIGKWLEKNVKCPVCMTELDGAATAATVD